MAIRAEAAVTFLSPWWLLALVVIPVAAVCAAMWARDRRRAARVYADPALLDVRASRGTRRIRTLAAVLGLAALGMGAVAMARPAVDRDTKERRPTLVLAIDTSKSMLETDVAPSRLEAAKVAINRLLDAAPKEAAVGLLSFNDGTQALVSPVTDREPVRRALDNLEIREGTAIGDAVVGGIEMLRAAQALSPDGSTDPSPGRILLLTDGAQSAGTVEPQDAGVRARGERVPVNTVLLGNDPGRFDRDPPEVTLSMLSRETGGIFTRSTSPEDLAQVFEDIGATLATVRRTDELTVYAVLAMLVLLVVAAAAAALSSRRVRSPRRPMGEPLAR
jgi:Ca-activated chloride channel homolog